MLLKYFYDPALAHASYLVIDTAPSTEFAAAHVPGTINIPVAMLSQWAGFFVDYDQPLHLVVNHTELPEVLRRLRSVFYI